MRDVHLLLRARFAQNRNIGVRFMVWMVFVCLVVLVALSSIAGDVVREQARYANPDEVISEYAWSLLATMLDPSNAVMWTALMFLAVCAFLSVAALSSPAPGQLLGGDIIRLSPAARVYESVVVSFSSVSPILGLSVFLATGSVSTTDGGWPRVGAILLALVLWVSAVCISTYVTWLRALSSRVGARTAMSMAVRVALGPMQGVQPLMATALIVSVLSMPLCAAVVALGVIDGGATWFALALCAVATVAGSAYAARNSVELCALTMDSPPAMRVVKSEKRLFERRRPVITPWVVWTRIYGRMIGRAQGVYMPLAVLGVPLIASGSFMATDSFAGAMAGPAIAVIWSISLTINMAGMLGGSGDWIASLDRTYKPLFAAMTLWSMAFPVALGTAVSVISYCISSRGFDGAPLHGLRALAVTLGVVSIAALWSFINPSRVRMSITASVVGPGSVVIGFVALSASGAALTSWLSQRSAGSCMIVIASALALTAVSFAVWKHQYASISRKVGSA